MAPTNQRGLGTFGYTPARKAQQTGSDLPSWNAIKHQCQGGAKGNNGQNNSPVVEPSIPQAAGTMLQAHPCSASALR